ncbi:MgtC/SapB family protein [Oscillatoria sp. FACHB-1407]|uniref:MgtC/SapB family protein n=1 Tax=Oscillatoria sp. FACHB-1407 TaxID=2692847 RepID=UPI001683AB17|nr:MgtC/SapB family protein [Oscillatoria sp. FACHB-1407]MBD2463736.1 MgtC/SapB family protein [Oscillatoria sp. FACHB-1407]
MTGLLTPLSWQEVLLRLGIALIVGAVVGLDREIKNKPAGLRTHMLVSLGSALFVLVPIQLSVAQESSEAVSRVLQGIITGVGFVGGGVILRGSGGRAESKIHGLTTAAAVWIASALGICAGSGLWQLGLIGAILSFLTLTTVKYVEKG